MFISVIIYMGIYKEPQIPIYWNTNFNKGPLHLILAHILLYCFN
jgi:hypothetical protein